MSESNLFNGWEQAVQWLREQPDQAELVLASYYDDPLETAAKRYWRSEEWSAISAFLPRGSNLRALDVGAGRGIGSYALAKLGFRVDAIEPNPSAIVGAEAIRALARESGLPIEVSADFSESLHFASGVFDVVFGRAVLHHARDLGSACCEFHRVLRPGGIMVMAREHVISRREDLTDFLAIHPLHERYGGENAFLLSEYVEAITAADLTLMRVIPPLRSPINYAPNSLDTLKKLAAQRVSARIPGIGAAVHSVLRLPGVWRALLPVLEWFDDRPGRHYSFVARRQ